MPTPIEQAREVARQSHETDGARKAVTTMQEDLRSMPASDRKQFFNELSRLDHEQHLPGFEITGDEAHHDRRVAATGQRPVYEESATITRGQGPYDALKRQHPEWTPEQLGKESRRVNEQTGRRAYNEGEKVSLNSDGSVTLRNENKDHPGQYSETRYKDGKPVSTRTGDGNNGWTEQQFGPDGKVTSTTKHEQKDGGSYKETVTGPAPDNKEISTKTREVKPDGSYVERNTDSASKNFTQTNYDVNGNPTGSVERSYRNPQDPNTYSEVRKDGTGKPTSSMDRRESREYPGYYVERTTPYTNGQPQRRSDVVRLYKNDTLQTDWGTWVDFNTNPDPQRLSV